MRQLHPDPFQLLIFILNSSQLFAALYLSGSRFQTMLPQNERDSFPYLLVLVLGSWRRLFILKLYGSIFRLKNSHRKEGFQKPLTEVAAKLLKTDRKTYKHRESIWTCYKSIFFGEREKAKKKDRLVASPESISPCEATAQE